MTPNETIHRLAHAVVELDERAKRAKPDTTFDRIARQIWHIQVMLLITIALELVVLVAIARAVAGRP